MISIEDACQTYAIERNTIEQWIIQDGVDYRYIWKGDEKIRMIPRSWLLQRTAGEGLRPQLLDEQGGSVEAWSSSEVSVAGPSLKPSQGEQRAFEMLQQVVSLQEYQERRIRRSNRFLGVLIVGAFGVMITGGFYLFKQNKISSTLSAQLAAFTQRATIERERSDLQMQLAAFTKRATVERERSELQTQLVALQARLTAIQNQKSELYNAMQAEQKKQGVLTESEHALQLKLATIELQKKEDSLRDMKGKNARQQEALEKQRARAIELDKKEMTLNYQLKMATVSRQVAELQARLEESQAQLENRNQQIRNLQSLIGAITPK